MQIIIIFAMCLIMSLNAFSQEEKTDERKSSTQLGYFYSPDYSVGVFKGIYGYATGLNFSKRIKKKCSIDIGLLFSSRGDQLDNLTFGNNLNVRTGRYDTTFSVKYKYQFIELPIKLKYFFLQKNKINIYMLVGISPNYFLRTRTVFDAYPITGGLIKGNEYTNKNVTFSTIVFSSLIGFGIEYKLSEKLNFTIQPEFRNYFTSLMVESPIAGIIYAEGLNCGICYNF